MSKPTTMHIEANFDVTQVSSTLECKFKRSDPKGNPLKGKFAGSVFFAQGEEVFVQVNAGGEQLLGGPQPFKSFSVIDCSITSRPRVFRCGPNEKKTVFAPPSPFLPLAGAATQGATVVLPASQFVDAPVVDTPPEYYQQGLAWSGKLVVGQVKARWRLTLLVTVQIEYADANVPPETRVYEIDPESEVGSGTGGPGEEVPEPMMVMATCMVDPESEVGSGTGKPGG